MTRKDTGAYITKALLQEARKKMDIIYPVWHEARREAKKAAQAKPQNAKKAAQAKPQKVKKSAQAQTPKEAIRVLQEAERKQDIDVILAVMAQHRDSTEVQQQGCWVLGHVAAYNVATQPTIAEKGGIEAVFHAMTQHSHHEQVQWWGCYMMNYMLDLESARPAIRKGKAVMDAARNNFPNNGGIQFNLKDVYAKI